MDTLDLRAQYAELTGDVKNAYAMREDGPEGFLYSDNTIRRALEQHGSLYDDPYTASRNQQAANQFFCRARPTSRCFIIYGAVSPTKPNCIQDARRGASWRRPRAVWGWRLRSGCAVWRARP